MDGLTPMSAQDALWLTMDRPNNLMIIDGVMIIAGNPTYESVLEVVRSRVTDRYPVYRRTPVRSGGGWAWRDDPDFDISRHIERVTLPEPADIPALQRFMAGQRSTPLPRTRPLWVVYVVDRVRLDDGTVGSAIVCRFHHAMSDGVRLTQVMLSLCDSDTSHIGSSSDSAAAVPPRDSDGSRTLLNSAPFPVADAVEIALDAAKAVGLGLAGAAEITGWVAAQSARALTDAVLHTVGHPIDAASAIPGTVASAPRVAWYLLSYGVDTLDRGRAVAAHPGRLVDAVTRLGDRQNRAVNDVSSVTKLLLSNTSPTLFSGEPGITKTIAWSPPMSLTDVKAVGRGQDATVNDVLLAAVAGGVARYLKLHHGCAREIQWLVPVNLKPFADNLPAELGNYFALVMLPMPLRAGEAKARIQQMKRQMERIKHSDEAALTFGVQRAMSLSPAQVQFFLTNFFANKTAGVLTNVPGPSEMLRFAGSPVRQIVGFAPCSGRQPIAATIFSYHDTVTIGFATDAGLIPDPDLLVDLVTQETADLKGDFNHEM